MEHPVKCLHCDGGIALQDGVHRSVGWEVPCPRLGMTAEEWRRETEMAEWMNGTDLENNIRQMRATLVLIRDEAATKENGGAWAAGMALLCLATLRS